MSTTHASNPVTIHESFWKTLDQLPVAVAPSGYRTISASSASTVDQDAISAFIQEDGNVLIKLGLHYLPKPPNVPFRLRQRMPQLETGHFLSTEGDVLRASNLYLLHPVNIAVNSLITNGHLYCTSEQSSHGGVRTDIRWVYRSSQSGQKTNIAVLEFKNTQVLRWADFLPATTDQQHAQDKLDDAQEKRHYTHLMDNACLLSKQAKKYCLKLSSPDVAIFDWNAMFVFDFTGMDEDAHDPILAKGIWFEEPATSVNSGVTFRTFLLGFLVRALRRHHVIA